jgi:hypothetical protein
VSGFGIERTAAVSRTQPDPDAPGVVSEKAVFRPATRKAQHPGWRRFTRKCSDGGHGTSDTGR